MWIETCSVGKWSLTCSVCTHHSSVVVSFHTLHSVPRAEWQGFYEQIDSISEGEIQLHHPYILLLCDVKGDFILSLNRWICSSYAASSSYEKNNTVFHRFTMCTRAWVSFWCDGLFYLFSLRFWSFGLHAYFPRTACLSETSELFTTLVIVEWRKTYHSHRTAIGVTERFP